MATRQGSLLPPIKIPGNIDVDRAVISALESIQAHLEAAGDICERGDITAAGYRHNLKSTGGRMGDDILR